MVKDKPTFAVGQTLWYRPAYAKPNRHGFWVKVLKVGRRWVQLTNAMRIDKTADRWYLVDGGGYSSPGKLYESWEQCRDVINTAEICRCIVVQLPTNENADMPITIDNAIRAAELLGITINKGRLVS